MENRDTFNSEIIVALNQEMKSLDQLFDFIAGELVERAFVVQDYANQLKLREREFPTGLVTHFGNVGIPHTNASFVKKPFVYAIRLIEAVDVKRMDQPDKVIPVKLFFILGFTKEKDQLKLLTKMMAALNNKDISNYFHHVDSQTQFEELLKKQL